MSIMLIFIILVTDIELICCIYWLKIHLNNIVALIIMLTVGLIVGNKINVPDELKIYF